MGVGMIIICNADVIIVRVMIMKKTENTPMYNELFTIRAYDNVEYVERLRNSRMFL